MQKKSVSLGYTKAKIKPFFNPLFWFSAVIISVFFYGLWQYSQNPDLFTRETGRPEIDSENNINSLDNNSLDNNSPDNITSENPIKEDNLNENDLSLLADIDNIGNLFQEVELKSVVKGKPAENPDFLSENAANITDFENVGSTFQEVKLNPLLAPGKSNNKNNNQTNFFQEFLKSDNLGLTNPLVSNNSQRQIPKIEVIKPQTQLPTLQDLTTRQREAMENDPLKQALQNQNLYVPTPLNTGNMNTFNNINNPVNSLGNNNMNNNSVMPNNPIFSGNNINNNLGNIPNNNFNNNINNNLGNIPNNINNNLNNNNSLGNNTQNNRPNNPQPVNNQPGFVSYY